MRISSMLVTISMFLIVNVYVCHIGLFGDNDRLVCHVIDWHSALLARNIIFHAYSAICCWHNMPCIL